MKKLLITLWRRKEEKKRAYWDSIRRAEQAHWDHVLHRSPKQV